MTDPQDAVASTFDAAADAYERGPARVWEPVGRRLVERADLRAGWRVLDAACGAGAVTVPAAERVAPDGSVVGVDLSHQMLDLARRNAEAAGVADRVDLRLGDMRWPPEDVGQLDAVLCSLGVFFVSDMRGLLAGWRERLRDGGVLGVTSWGATRSQELWDGVWDAVRAQDPGFRPPAPPWISVSTAEGLHNLLEAAGFPGARVEVELLAVPLDGPADAWRMVEGGGFRAVLERLGPEGAERARQRFLAAFPDGAVREMAGEVVYGVAARS